MESLKITLLFVAIFAAACAQRLPRCRDLVNDYSSRKEVLFRGRRVEGACSRFCVTSRGRVRRYESCCSGLEAFVPSGADKDATVVVNAFRYIVECNSPAPIPVAPPGSGSEIVDPSEEPATETNVLQGCPSGPTRTQDYTYSSLEKICEFKCEFGVASQGVSIGKRSRTIYRCCQGEAQIASRALGLYRCP